MTDLVLRSVKGSELTHDEVDANFTALRATADGAVQSVVAGTNVTVDNTDPLNPVVNVTAGAGDLLAANNLSDVANAATARTNLGLGSAATQASGAFDAAGAASAALAAALSADFSGAYADLSGKPTLGTAADNAEGDFATAAQGTTADGAAQKSANLSDLANAGTARTNLGLATVAASGSAADLSAGILPDARMPNLTGDVTTSEGAVATTLATVNSNVGAFTNANITVNAKGQVTAAANGSGASSDAILGQPSGGGAVIPGLSASPDIRVAGAADDEFDTTDTSDPMTGWTTLGAPTTHDINSTVKSHYRVQKSAASGDALHGIYKACPSIPFTMTAKVSAAHLKADYNGAGIFIAEAAPGKLATLAVMHHAAIFATQPQLAVVADLWTNRTTFNVNISGQGGFDAPIYLRIVVTLSTNVAYYYSKDGIIWRVLASAHNPAFTVGAVGLYIASVNVTHAGEAAFDWVRFT